MTWLRHLRTMLWTFAGVTAALIVFVVAMNPYGNLPNLVLREHVMMDDNQRYQYPSVVRSGRYDSIIIGTSTSRLLDPKPFAEQFGGRFANVALNSGTAWEQTELSRLFLRHQPSPHSLVIGVDTVWCSAEADRERITFRGFPEWMYDDNPWNDLGYLLNTRAIEIAGRRMGAVLGLSKPRLPPDGWEIFTPPERDYDLAKALVKIYGNGPRRLPEPVRPAASPSAQERASWLYPALDWMEKLIEDGRWKHVLIVFPPVHVMAQPVPGSMAEAREAECKRRIAAIGQRHKAPVIDFRIASDITTRDENYWDPLHYRVAIAERIVSDIRHALKSRQPDGKSAWRLLD